MSWGGDNSSFICQDCLCKREREKKKLTASILTDLCAQ